MTRDTVNNSGVRQNIRAPLNGQVSPLIFYKLVKYVHGGSQALGSLESCPLPRDAGVTATAGSDVVQSGRPIFDDFFQHLWPYIGNNTANVVFQMVKRLWLIRIAPQKIV
ncbi:hypothetical protein TNCV_863931 [Trichonephila clavipes]|nr:hypothetical protein TNCV_863931 [Trichonephila clavipes]